MPAISCYSKLRPRAPGVAKGVHDHDTALSGVYNPYQGVAQGGKYLDKRYTYIKR